MGSEERARKIEQRLDQVEERMEKLEKWVQQLDLVVEKLRDRLDRIESQVRGEGRLRRMLRRETRILARGI